VAFFAPIRTTGTYEATVKLHSDMVATLKLEVVAKK
jgi:ribosomal protein L9